MRKSHFGAFAEHIESLTRYEKDVEIEFKNMNFPLCMRLLTEQKLTRTFSCLRKIIVPLSPNVIFKTGTDFAYPHVVFTYYPCFYSKPFRGISKKRMAEIIHKNDHVLDKVFEFRRNYD